MLRVFFFFSSRRRHTRLQGDWSSDVCSSDLALVAGAHKPVAGNVAVWIRWACAADGPCRAECCRVNPLDPRNALAKAVRESGERVSNQILSRPSDVERLPAVEHP